MRTFVVSDIHGLSEVLLNALARVDFKKSGRNADHLVVAGDMFDRGNSSREVWEVLQSIPNRTLLWGNHELLLLNTIERGFCSYTDYHNGIAATIESFGADPRLVKGRRLAGLAKQLRLQLSWKWESDHYLICHSITRELFERFTPTWEKVVWADPTIELERRWLLTENYGCPFLPKTVLFGHWHAKVVREHFGAEPVDEVWVGGPTDMQPPCFVALDTCTNRSNHLGIVELVGNGEVVVH